MSLAESFIREFTHESAGTAKLIGRLPEDQLSWKPHEKSMTLGGLATHLAEIPEWAKTIVGADSFDIGASDYRPRAFTSRGEIMELFQKNADGFREVLEGQSDAHLFGDWRLLEGDRELVKMPRVACIRSFVLCHTVHHRGQLTVYLRMQDVPLPALYGPSADEAI